MPLHLLSSPAAAAAAAAARLAPSVRVAPLRLCHSFVPAPHHPVLSLFLSLSAPTLSPSSPLLIGIYCLVSVVLGFLQDRVSMASSVLAAAARSVGSAVAAAE